MNNSARVVALAGAILSFSAVFLAALGSHLIDMKGMLGIWQTASIIHMFHSVAIIALAALLAIRESRALQWGAWLLVWGTVVFCGSIYLHVVTGYKVWGVAPAGGLLMMAGWSLAVVAFLRKS